MELPNMRDWRVGISMLQVKCAQGCFFNNPLRQQSVQIVHGHTVVTDEMAKWTYHVTTVENCPNIEAEGLIAGCPDSHDAKERSKGKGRRHSNDKSRGS